MAKRYITKEMARVYEKHGHELEYFTKNPYKKKAPITSLCEKTPTKPNSKSKKVSKKFIKKLVKLIEKELG